MDFTSLVSDLLSYRVPPRDSPAFGHGRKPRCVHRTGLTILRELREINKLAAAYPRAVTLHIRNDNRL